MSGKTINRTKLAQTNTNNTRTVLTFSEIPSVNNYFVKDQEH